MSAGPQLRPLSVGETLDVAFKLYSTHWQRFAATIAVVVIPVQVIEAIIRLSTISGITDGQLLTNDRTAYNAGTIAIAVIGLVSAPLITGVSFRAVSQAYLGDVPSVRGSLGFAARRIHSVLWVNVLVIFAAILGILALIVGLFWVLVTFSVAVPALLVEGRKGRKALGRSRELVSGRRWPVLGIIVIAALIVIVSGSLVGVVVGVIIAKTHSVGVYVLALGLLGGLVSILVTPFQVAVTTVLYYDLRVRKEGLDLALTIDALGLPPALAPAPAPASGPPSPFGPPAAPSPFGAPDTGGLGLPGGFAPPVAPDPVRREPPRDP